MDFITITENCFSLQESFGNLVTELQFSDKICAFFLCWCLKAVVVDSCWIWRSWVINILEHYEPQRKAKEFSEFIVGLFLYLWLQCNYKLQKMKLSDEQKCFHHILALFGDCYNGCVCLLVQKTHSGAAQLINWLYTTENVLMAVSCAHFTSATSLVPAHNLHVQVAQLLLFHYRVDAPQMCIRAACASLGLLCSVHGTLLLKVTTYL